MKLVRHCAFLLSCSVLLENFSALAAVSDKLTIGGKIWANYSVNLTDGAGSKNGFDITRAYLQTKYQFNETWSSFVLLDHDRSKSTTASPTWVYVRNAYVQADDIWGGKGMFRFGLQPTLFINAVEGVIKTRWLGKTLTDEAGMLSSQDAGVRIGGNLMNDKVKYAAEIHNGLEGLSKAGNTDNGLAYSFSMTVLPFMESSGALARLGFSLSETAFAGTNTPTAFKNLLSGAVHLEHDLVDMAVEFAFQRQSGANAVGYGATANLKLMEQASLYARFFSGNAGFKTLLGADALFGVGPTYSFMKDAVTTAMLYEIRTQATGSAKQAFTWLWAVNF